MIPTGEEKKKTEKNLIVDTHSKLEALEAKLYSFVPGYKYKNRKEGKIDKKNRGQQCASGVAMTGWRCMEYCFVRVIRV